MRVTTTTVINQSANIKQPLPRPKWARRSGLTGFPRSTRRSTTSRKQSSEGVPGLRVLMVRGFRHAPTGSNTPAQYDALGTLICHGINLEACIRGRMGAMIPPSGRASRIPPRSASKKSSSG
jgi:hypothetical protein